MGKPRVLTARWSEREHLLYDKDYTSWRAIELLSNTPKIQTMERRDSSRMMHNQDGK